MSIHMVWRSKWKKNIPKSGKRVEILQIKKIRVRRVIFQKTCELNVISRETCEFSVKFRNFSSQGGPSGFTKEEEVIGDVLLSSKMPSLSHLTADKATTIAQTQMLLQLLI